MFTSAGWWGVARAGRGGGCAWAGAAPNPKSTHSVLARIPLAPPSCEKSLKWPGEKNVRCAPLPGACDGLDCSPGIVSFHGACHPALNEPPGHEVSVSASEQVLPRKKHGGRPAATDLQRSAPRPPRVAFLGGSCTKCIHLYPTDGSAHAAL